MKMARALDTLDRVWRTKVLRFGRYEKVVPAKVSCFRLVPDNIVKPPYYKTGVPLPPLSQAEIKNTEQIDGMKKSCSLASQILANVKNILKVGITTDAIDEYVHNQCIEHNSYPSTLNYRGYPKSVCTSVNNVTAHGIPDSRPLQDGDIINVDITIFYGGFHGDCSKTFLIGDVDDKGKELVTISEECLNAGIRECGPSVPFKEIGRAIKKHAENNKLTVLPTILGHGIGSYFHGPPDIYHTLNRYPGVMKPGMTFTVEPALSQGGKGIYVLPDKWTVVTADGARTAQAEHTILITEDGPLILTDKHLPQS